MMQYILLFYFTSLPLMLSYNDYFVEWCLSTNIYSRSKLSLVIVDVWSSFTFIHCFAGSFSFIWHFVETIRYLSRCAVQWRGAIKLRVYHILYIMRWKCGQLSVYTFDSVSVHCHCNGWFSLLTQAFLHQTVDYFYVSNIWYHITVIF